MRTRLLVLALTLSVLPSIAGAQNREHLQLTADLRILQETITRLELRVNQLDEQVRAANRRLDDQADASLKSFANEQQLVKELQTTVSAVKERLDDNTVRLSQLTQETSGVRQSLGMVTELLNTMLNLLQPPSNLGAGDAAGAARGTGPASPLGNVAAPASPAAAYAEARGDYLSGHWDLAIDGFKEFVQKYPESPDAPQAQFLLGESYYSQGKCREALPAFGTFISTYKSSEQVPEAYYMQGLCYDALGQHTEARKIFTQVIKDYPNSTSALQAAQKL
ncbi:MAG: tol-pal system protein YbgF, partial [Acidobacteriota bacterium]